MTLSALGRLDDALAAFAHCVDELRRFNDMREEIIVLDEDMGPLLFRLERHDDAVRAWERALVLARSVGTTVPKGSKRGSRWCTVPARSERGLPSVSSRPVASGKHVPGRGEGA